MAASYSFRPIGIVRSSLREIRDAPNQASEGAPEALLEIDPEFAVALCATSSIRTKQASLGVAYLKGNVSNPVESVRGPVGRPTGGSAFLQFRASGEGLLRHLSHCSRLSTHGARPHAGLG